MMDHKLEFVENGHQYLYKGHPVPSVSEILRPLGGEPVDDEAEDTYLALALDAAAERGILLHGVLQRRLGGEAAGEIPDAYAAHLEAVQRFLSEHTIIPYMMETPLFHPDMRIAGTPDLVCNFDGVDAIVDYKFVASINKTRVKAQLNAYRLLCEVNNIYVDALYAVQFMGTGRYRLYPAPLDEAEFALCYGIYHARMKKHPRGAIA